MAAIAKRAATVGPSSDCFPDLDSGMHDAPIKIGSFTPVEADQLGIIFFDAVREGAAGVYDDDQRRAWASKVPSGPNWAYRLTSQRTLVARQSERPVGFMTLADDGYIDLAFVAPAFQRRGVGGLLYTRIEALAREAGIQRLYSDASYLVRGLFEQQGWMVVQEQRIERAGVALPNFAMEKRLCGSV